jgi:hypothetical protein
MYAKGLPRYVYHLLAPGEHRTLCGLSVVPIIIDRPVNTSTLHLTSERPANSTRCKDCAKAEADASKND